MALLFFIIFLVAIIGRILMQYIITGNHGIRPTKSTSSLIAKTTSFLLLTSFLIIFILVVLDFQNIIEQHFTNYPTLIYIGLTLTTAGIVLMVMAQIQMGISWRIGVDETEETKLITHGLYAHIRNPIYSGVILFCIGLVLLLPNIYMLCAIILVYISIELHVYYVEEPYLHNLHGVEFKNYINLTGRYFPKVT